jgi:hypothetical protein
MRIGKRYMNDTMQAFRLKSISSRQAGELTKRIDQLLAETKQIR